MGFVPLFFALENKHKGKAFLLAYFTGVIFWAGTIYWLIHVTFPGTILLVLYLAAYFGIFGLIVSTVDCGLWTVGPLVSLPCLWVLLEYLRSRLLTGFGWALLAYSQYLDLPLIQIADVTGVWGVSFLVLMVNVAVKEIISPQSTVHSSQQKINYKFILAACGMFLFVFGYGSYKLYQRPTTDDQRQLKVSVIQGNIPQELKWQAQSQGFILDKYTTLTRQASADKPDLIIWPEAASPGLLFRGTDAWIFRDIFELAQEVKTNLLIGSAVEGGNDYFNSALLVDSTGKVIQRYDKLRLVPFGEYIPLRKTLRFLETVVPIGDFTAGREYTIFKPPVPQCPSAPVNFAVLICFEDLFPELSRRFVGEGARFLINITNDAWFKQTSAPYQHLSASVFRAIENRRFLVRAANTGVSGFISPSGRIQPLVSSDGTKAIFTEGIETGIVYGRSVKTFYTRYGDLFVLLCLFLLICGIIIQRVKAAKIKAGL